MINVAWAGRNKIKTNHRLGFDSSLNVKRYVLILAAVWTMVIVLLFSWHRAEISKKLSQLACIQAENSFEKDLVYRRWSSAHGGVYVPPTEETPPNPYLSHIKNRDITTADGMRLTLMNPAYMTRQVHKLGKDQYGHQGHITSLNPLRPANAPDAWEADALRAFERGETKVVEIANIGNEEYMRLMLPLIVEKGCLRCHAFQGYREGDLRGGISVSVPMAPLRSVMQDEVSAVAKSYAVIWLLGLGGIGFGSWRIFFFIHNRGLAVARLRDSEVRMAMVLQGAGLGTWDWNIVTDEVIYDERWAAMLGYTLGEIEANLESWKKLIHPDDLSNVMEVLNAHLEGSTDDYEMEHRMRHKSGRWVWIQGKGQVLKRDTDGRPLRMCGMYLDITERKQTEMTLSQSAKLLEASQSIARVGGWELDIATKDLYWTAETYRIHDTSPEEFSPSVDAGVNCFLPESRLIISAALEAAIKHGEGYDLELEVMTTKGRRINIRTSCEVTLHEGRPVKLTGTFQDITGHRLLKDQLRQAQKLESIGRLASGVAHDFNNALQGIQGFCELMKMSLKSGSQEDINATEILKSAVRANNLTRQLLAFARKEVIAPKVLDLNTTVEESLKMLGRLIGEDIDLLWEPSAKPWLVKMDPAQIDQILANLSVNARDALSGIGKVTIETRNITLDQAGCSIHPDAIPGAYVQLSFSDNGCGMDEETLSHLFEPFFTTKELDHGTGLGLATLHDIAEQNHGFITVVSTPGKGTTFKFHLPRCADEEVAAEKAAQTNPPERGDETLLLVEDDAELLDLGRQMLEGLGYTVLAANLPKEAIRLAEKHTGKIDLILTDVVMPKMNGRDLATVLQALRPDLKCLFMSGYTADVIARNSVLAEGTHFIPKPFSTLELATKLRDVLDE